MKREDLINHLDRQLNFLEHSCWLYDKGFRDEGIRIATVIRVLMYNGRGPSLLRQLNAGRIDVLDTCRPGYLEQVTDLGGPFIDAHLVALRQMAYELLNSRVLVELASTVAPLTKRIRDSRLQVHSE